MQRASNSGGVSCRSCITPWAEENLDELRITAEVESEHLQEVLQQIQSLQSLPAESRKAKLEQLVNVLQYHTAKEELQQLLESLDCSLGEFMGDPRRFVACIAQIISCLDSSPEKTQLAVQRFIQDKQIEQISSPAPFDWTMVDMLLSQLSHLMGPMTTFSKEMKDSVLLTLFPSTAEGHFLQDLVSHCLTMSVGEQISIVRQRMHALSQAPLSKVTLLSNMILEINEKYEKEIDKLKQKDDAVNV